VAGSGGADADVTRLLAAAVVAAVMVFASTGCRRPQHDGCADCNVVLISIDTLRADHVGAYGYALPTTPRFDALAAKGVLFENAIAQSSWTRPAHMSIFTGLHPHEHGFVSLGDTRRLEDSIPTLATVLKDKGYQTAAFVGGVNLSASFGFNRGFDTYRSNGKYFRDNLEDIRYWLDHRPPGRFFLFLQGYDPHTPYLSDPVDRQVFGLPAAPPQASHGATCRSEGPVSRIDPYIKEYDAATHRGDRYVGKLVDELTARGLMQRTILVVLSDHGEEFLEHGRCFHLATLHREVLHVPLLIVAPGLVPRRVPGLVSASVTIAPTVMELLGGSIEPFPGPSLVEAAAGGPTPDDLIVSETERTEARRGDGHVRSLTTARDKLIHWTTQKRFALYDVIKDPGETSALTAPDRQRELAAELDKWTAAHPPRVESRRAQTSGTSQASDEPDNPDYPDDPGGSDDEDHQRRAEDLRSLGYAE